MKKRNLLILILAGAVGLNSLTFSAAYAAEAGTVRQTDTGNIQELDETAVPIEDSTEPEATTAPETGEAEPATQEQAESEADKEEITSEPVEKEQETQIETTEVTDGEIGPQEQTEVVNTLSSASTGTVTISTASQLKDFRDRVNNGEYSLNATLTADIDLENESWGNGIGYTPPATGFGTAYTGTFDGNGHAITNVNISGQYNGFFGVIGEGGIVRNLCIYGSISGTKVGFARGNYGTIENCAVYLNITASGGLNGGIAGYNGGTIRNCIYGGQINQADYQTAAIVGWQYEEGSVTNCYYIPQTSGVGAFGTGSGTAESKTADQFKSGEVAWLLNDGSPDGVWKQTIGTDDYPDFTGNTVYQWSDGTYRNEQQPVAPTPEFTTTQTASSVTVNLTNYQSDYGEAQYKWDDGEWGTGNTLSDLGANSSHTVSVRYAGQGSYAQSEEQTQMVYTNTASYTITIPASLTVTKEYQENPVLDTAFSVDTSQNFDLGHNGKVVIYGTNENIKPTLTRQNGTETVRANLYTKETNGTEHIQQDPINPLVMAIFDRKDSSPVYLCGYIFDLGTEIAAGTYSGTVTFQVEYTEQADIGYDVPWRTEGKTE